MAWSRDSRYIAVTAKDWGSTDIYLMKPDGSNALLLTKGAGVDAQPAWSPNGHSLALVSDRDGSKSIWIATNLEPFLKRVDDPPNVITLPHRGPGS